jgi:hypothetical protein
MNSFMQAFMQMQYLPLAPVFLNKIGREQAFRW